jgi:RimJ/RimL family protein N-acetyltransferase
LSNLSSRTVVAKDQPLFYAVVDLRLKKPVGVSSFDFIDDVFGAIEIGHLNFSPLMQRSLVSSEAVIIMIRKAFELGFRRVAWRCHSLNAASISAAKRFGFKFEAFFKYYSVMKGHNRNNLWYSIIADDWPQLNEIYTKWFESGCKKKLGDLTREIGGNFFQLDPKFQ